MNGRKVRVEDVVSITLVWERMTFYILTYGHRKKYDHCIISDYVMEAMVSPSAPTRVERNIIMADNNSQMEQADFLWYTLD